MGIVDLHCDTLLWSLRKPEDPLGDEERQINRERLLQGDSLAQCFALFVPNLGEGSFSEQEEACYGLFHKLADSFHTVLKQHESWLAQARCSADIRANQAAGKVSALLTLEDGTFVAGHMERLKEAADMGARALALTWNTENCFGYSNSPDRAAHQLPLKAFGREAVAFMNDLGVLVDVSHLNEGGFWDVAAISRKPFLATHSCARSLVDHPRNLTDRQIRAVADSGGVVGVNFYPPFISPDGMVTTVELVIHQIQYLLQVGGEDHVAFGSDFDGMSGAEIAFGGFEGFRAITEALYRALPGRIADKICFQNALRVFE
ncbi:MAG: dipeptidase [Oscillospiraceae bacterium]|nr:dipeptidase [Oscillospiraceae bacterium]